MDQSKYKVLKGISRNTSLGKDQTKKQVLNARKRNVGGYTSGLPTATLHLLCSRLNDVKNEVSKLSAK
jgi:hypothetical protein